jgi:dihydroorotate dehydrogenase (NAD+) catalytic subunit
MYDANQSYLYNYSHGPNLNFVKPHTFPNIVYTKKPKFSFLGIPLHIPFGIPAGPLLNSKFVQMALNAGFCLPTYKTVRSCAWDSHPWPNILKINTDHQTDLLSDSIPTVVGTTFAQSDYQQKNLSISNSFGVPSKSPEIWSQDFQNLSPYSQQTGQHVVLSFQGSKNKKNLYDDIAHTCELAIETVQKTGFSLLEINLSCPNEVNEPIYKSQKDAIQALKAAHNLVKQHKTIKLIAKIGALNANETYTFVSEAAEYVHSISAINTVLAKIIDKHGQIALGSKSPTGGVCGAAILKQGLIMCENLAHAREKCGLKSTELALIGVGGVSTAEHFKNYINAGADAVQAATGMMWNLNLAQDIAQYLAVPFDEKSGNK